MQEWWASSSEWVFGNRARPVKAGFLSLCRCERGFSVPVLGFDQAVCLVNFQYFCAKSAGWQRMDLAMLGMDL